jgi:hypothetical protein
LVRERAQNKLSAAGDLQAFPLAGTEEMDDKAFSGGKMREWKLPTMEI